MGTPTQSSHGTGCLTSIVSYRCPSLREGLSRGFLRDYEHSWCGPSWMLYWELVTWPHDRAAGRGRAAGAAAGRGAGGGHAAHRGQPPGHRRAPPRRHHHLRAGLATQQTGTRRDTWDVHFQWRYMSPFDLLDTVVNTFNVFTFWFKREKRLGYEQL